MTTTSSGTNSARVPSCLAYLTMVGLAPDQVAAKVKELRPAVLAGDGAAMKAAIDQARSWWDSYDLALRITADEEDNEAHHLTHGWNDLMELVARAPARCITGILAKAELAAWHRESAGGEACWEMELARTMLTALAELAQGSAAGVQRHG